VVVVVVVVVDAVVLGVAVGLVAVASAAGRIGRLSVPAVGCPDEATKENALTAPTQTVNSRAARTVRVPRLLRRVVDARC